jgi:hypothetical protein
MGVPGISGWNGGGFGGGLFGGFAPTAVSAVSTVSMANNGHSRQRSQSSDMDALAMDSLENDLMALTGGLNLDDDEEETEVEPRGVRRWKMNRRLSRYRVPPRSLPRTPRSTSWTPSPSSRFRPRRLRTTTTTTSSISRWTRRSPRAR